ncbi:MAG: hypothetical protein KKE53_11285 [Proteobacteria bacterium]|nr:hypothetical protein [Pseudomonadota bacterium]
MKKRLEQRTSPTVQSEQRRGQPVPVPDTSAATTHYFSPSSLQVTLHFLAAAGNRLFA